MYPLSLFPISHSTIVVIACFSSSVDLKYLPTSRLLRSLHTVSMGLSCGVYGGRNSSSTSSPADSTYSMTAFDLWQDALSSTM